MSIMAGIISRSTGTPVPENLCSELSEVIFKHRNGKLLVHRSEQAFLAKVDLGIFSSPGFHSDIETNCFSMLVGEPYLIDSSESKICTREDDILLLHNKFAAEDWNVLQKARGIFAFAQYNSNKKIFSLATDKMGIRPVYVWSNKDYIVFSTSLRVIENFILIPKIMDLVAVTQIIRLGYPLGRRTPYAGVEMLESAEHLLFRNNTFEHRFYYNWDSEIKNNFDKIDWPKEAQKRFISAVHLRLKSRKNVYSFLSGGLDSRSVVGALRELGVTVKTFGFGLLGAQDDIFAQLFAKKINCDHTAVGRKNTAIRCEDGEWSFLIAHAIANDQGVNDQSHKAFYEVWSGDGGSVSVGFVYFSREIISCLQKKDIHKAIDIHLKRDFSNLSKRVLKSSIYKELELVTENEITQELDKIKCNDPIRRFHLYLMKNDQRRHLAGHFETIDQHGIELILPFFDSNFLEFILHLPPEACLEHKFYHQWMQVMHPSICEVPWQTYPGHEVCPIPAPENLAYQWNTKQSKQDLKHTQKELLKRGLEILKIKKFPHSILNKSAFRLIHWANHIRVPESDCAIDTIETYLHYLKVSNGRHVLSK